MDGKWNLNDVPKYNLNPLTERDDVCLKEGYKYHIISYSDSEVLERQNQYYHDFYQRFLSSIKRLFGNT